MINYTITITSILERTYIPQFKGITINCNENAKKQSNNYSRCITIPLRYSLCESNIYQGIWVTKITCFQSLRPCHPYASPLILIGPEQQTVTKIKI